MGSVSVGSKREGSAEVADANLAHTQVPQLFSLHFVAPATSPKKWHSQERLGDSAYSSATEHIAREYK